ncbi:MAG: DsbA family protein [Solirubrobacteraceae bacterium]
MSAAAVTEAIFFFGAMSPYSWLAAERIGTLIPGARWEAVFAGAVFRAAGRSSWGLGEHRAAGLADCEQRAQARGLGPIRWPEPWPTNDVLIARAITFVAGQPDGHADGQAGAREFALTAMRAAFHDGVDLGAPAAVPEVARRAGWGVDAVARGATTPAVKQALRATTDRAVALGVVGVPTVVVGARRFWGDDQLEAAAGAVSRGE